MMETRFSQVNKQSISQEKYTPLALQNLQTLLQLNEKLTPEQLRHSINDLAISAEKNDYTFENNMELLETIDSVLAHERAQNKLKKDEELLSEILTLRDQICARVAHSLAIDCRKLFIAIPEKEFSTLEPSDEFYSQIAKVVNDFTNYVVMNIIKQYESHTKLILALERWVAILEHSLNERNYFIVAAIVPAITGASFRSFNEKLTKKSRDFLDVMEKMLLDRKSESPNFRPLMYGSAIPALNVFSTKFQRNTAKKLEVPKKMIRSLIKMQRVNKTFSESQSADKSWLNTSFTLKSEFKKMIGDEAGLKKIKERIENFPMKDKDTAIQCLEEAIYKDYDEIIKEKTKLMEQAQFAVDEFEKNRRDEVDAVLKYLNTDEAKLRKSLRFKKIEKVFNYIDQLKIEAILKFPEAERSNVRNQFHQEAERRKNKFIMFFNSNMSYIDTVYQELNLQDPDFLRETEQRQNEIQKAFIQDQTEALDRFIKYLDTYLENGFEDAVLPEDVSKDKDEALNFIVQFQTTPTTKLITLLKKKDALDNRLRETKNDLQVTVEEKKDIIHNNFSTISKLSTLLDKTQTKSITNKEIRKTFNQAYKHQTKRLHSAQELLAQQTTNGASTQTLQDLVIAWAKLEAATSVYFITKAKEFSEIKPLVEAVDFEHTDARYLGDRKKILSILKKLKYSMHDTSAKREIIFNSIKIELEGKLKNFELKKSHKEEIIVLYKEIERIEAIKHIMHGVERRKTNAEKNAYLARKIDEHTKRLPRQLNAEDFVNLQSLKAAFDKLSHEDALTHDAKFSDSRSVISVGTSSSNEEGSGSSEKSVSVSNELISHYRRFAPENDVNDTETQQSSVKQKLRGITTEDVLLQDEKKSSRSLFSPNLNLFGIRNSIDPNKVSKKNKPSLELMLERKESFYHQPKAAVAKASSVLNLKPKPHQIIRSASVEDSIMQQRLNPKKP